MTIDTPTRLRSRFRGRRVIAVALAAGLIAAACGSDDSSDVTTQAPGTTGSPDTTTGSPDTTTGSPDTTTGSPDTTAGAPDTTLPAGDFDPNGEVVLLASATPTTFDPHRIAAFGAYPFVFEIYEQLTKLDLYGNVEPMLASSWEFSDDGSQLVFTLRDDVEFHDGTPLDAEAVKKSLDRAIELDGSVWKQALAAVSSVDVTGPYEVTLELSGPGGDLPAVLASPPGSIINPTVLDSGRDIGTDPGRDAGSAPRVLDTFTLNESASFVRAGDDHWDPEANKLARLTLTRSVESAARMNAIRSGQANVIQIKADQKVEADNLDGQPDYDFIEPEGVYVGHYAFYMRSTRSNFDELAVRQAVNHALNREEISNFLLNGDCVPTTQAWAEGQPGYNADLANTYAYDVDEAKRLLESVGLGDGFTFESTVVAGLSPQNDIAQVVQQQLSEIGLEMIISPLDSATATSEFNGGNMDAYTNIVVGQADPSQLVERHFTAGINLSNDLAPEIIDLAAQAKDRTVPAEEWTDLYRQIGRILHEKAVYAPICFMKSQWLVRDGVTGVDTMSWQGSAIYNSRYLGVAAG